MPAPKRNPTQRAHDRLFIEQRYLRGETCREIARALSEARPYSLSHAQVHHDLKLILAEWVEHRERDFDQAAARELEKVNHLERTAWEAWERSVGIRQTRTVENKTDSDGESNREQIREEDLNGDPRYLQAVQWCIAKRCELLGLDAPLRIDGEIRHSAKPNLRALNMQELEQLEHIIDKAATPGD